MKANRARVCLVVEGFYPPTTGGQAQNLHHLAAAIADMGTQVMVITRQSTPPSFPEETVKGMAVIRIPPPGQLTGKGWGATVPLAAFLIRLFFRLVRESHRYDVLLLSGLKSLPFVAFLIRILLNKKCVIRPESTVELAACISAQSLRRMGLKPNHPLVRLVRWMQRKLAKSADHLVAISAEMRNALLTAGVPPNHVSLIPNGIDLTTFRPAGLAEKLALRDKLGLPRDQAIFLFTGRITVSKGVPELIRVWRKLAARDERVLLVLLGSGSGSFDDCEPQVRKTLAEEKLQPWLVLPGKVTNVSDYLRAVDVFVFPSHYEGFGLSLAEAMACGLPAIVTRVGVATEVMENEKTGVLIGCDNEPELEAAIGWMLKNKAFWPAMGLRALQHVSGRFDIASTAARHIETIAAVWDPSSVGASNAIHAVNQIAP